MRCPVLVGVVLAAIPLVAGPSQAGLEENLGGLGTEQVEGYLDPLVGGLSTSINTGIFRSGNIPPVGFSFTVDLRAAYIGFRDDDRLYRASTPGYATVEAPTAIGDVGSVTAPHETIPGQEFTYPGGFDMAHFGVAVPQLTVGNVAGTRAMLRWVPEIDIGDEDIGTFEMFGIGAQHSISQYLEAPPVDVAVGVMYQSLKLGGDLIDAKAMAFNVMGSRRFGQGVNVEPYVGVGLDSFRMDVEYESGNETNKVEFDRENDFHLTLGTTLNLPGVKLNAEYNVAAVNGFAGGISFGM